MALYRETATGFLCEYASNPGAGYTAISAQPTDTVANRVTWWRGLDTYGQTTAWHPSEYRSPQDPAEATLDLRFSQDAAFISADASGTVTNPRDAGNTYYLGATADVRIYRGVSDVTVSEGWVLTKVDDACTSTLSLASGVNTLYINSISSTQGSVTITATRNGVTRTRVYRYLKVLKGADGAAGSAGPSGQRGSRQILVTTATGAWADLTAWNGIVSQTGTNPVPSDLVTIAKTDGSVATSKFYVSGASPGTWQTPTAYINGSLLVTGTVGANRLAAGSITADRLAAGTITAASGVIGSLDASKITTGTLSANYISGGTINGTNVTVTNLSATNITGGTLSVDRIAANSISGGKITVGGVYTTNIASGAISWIDSKGRVHSSPLSQTTTSGVEIEIAQSTLPSNADRGKVLITCFLDVSSPSYTAAPGQACNLFIYRGATRLDYQGIYVVSQYYHQMSLSFVDTSAPTSSTTYYFKWKWTTGSSGCLLAGSITLMELKR